MTGPTREQIAFDVETERILQILSSEIYDSPKAFLRENVQNAYDAILMRCTAQELPLAERIIEVTVGNGQLTVRDDGIGMSDEVLKNNFWKAGSSGKKSELAQRSGVIGTFGIGAMANFGVCTALRVETRHVDSEVTLISSARRSELRIAQNCIDLERVSDGRESGTIVRAELDPAFAIDENSAIEYLNQYVRFLPVRVTVNGNLISQNLFEDTLGSRAAGYTQISSRTASSGEFSGHLKTLVNPQGRVLARLQDITLNDIALEGELFFVQQGGQTLGFRNSFGLAPIPVSGVYGFGGYVNLNILHPTAGREALSRESIQQVAELVSLIEAEISKDLAETPFADENQQFQQYILSHGLIQLAKNIKIPVLPSQDQLRLDEVRDFEPQKAKHFYPGHDSTILHRFASEQANLFHVSQANPRRKLQLRYLGEEAGVAEVPETTIVDRLPATQLTLDEAMFLMRLRGILLEDYFISDVDAAFATISHGVTLHIEKQNNVLHISIARNMPAARMAVEAYRSAHEVFHGFVIDFVRENLYPQIRNHVPSSTRQGRDALYRRLKENEELFRYELSDFGEAESLLADYLAGKTDLEQVLRYSGGYSGGGQRQELRKEQVGSVEEELPGIIESPGDSQPGNEYEATPPIIRNETSSDMKVLTVSAEHSKLNGFQMFLAVSDRLARREGEFLRQPHTTKLMWGSHRVIYIFTDATGDLSLYYDIRLTQPLESQTTGGSMVPTTTIVTRTQIFVPVPKVLESAFQIVEGAKEFYVRFDTIP